MFYWFRGHAAQIAFATLISLLSLGASTLSPHGDDCHETVCLPMAVEHDADAHHFVAPPTAIDAPHLHCLVCHWARSFRPNITSRYVETPAVLTRTFARFDLVVVARNAQVALPPLRSPPSSPLA
jgi:hypothetical protein